MNILHNREFRADGIFGDFTFAGDDHPFMVTLQHAYEQADTGKWLPKIPPGTYTCQRGMHSLHHYNGGFPFATFEITGVPGHSGLLFHPGNFDADSIGCVLCGQTEIVRTDGVDMITGSDVEFAAFMARLAGINSFTLQVVNS